jgi:hypothetical protein
VAIKVILADDSVIVREGLQQLLSSQADFEVVFCLMPRLRLAQCHRDGRAGRIVVPLAVYGESASVPFMALDVVALILLSTAGVRRFFQETVARA